MCCRILFTDPNPSHTCIWPPLLCPPRHLPCLPEILPEHLGQPSLHLPGLPLNLIIRDLHSAELAHFVPASHNDCAPTVCRVFGQKQGHSCGQAIQSPSPTGHSLHMIQFALTGTYCKPGPALRVGDTQRTVRGPSQQELRANRVADGRTLFF